MFSNVLKNKHDTEVFMTGYSLGNGNGGGTSAVITPLTVAENGTYTATDYGCDGFDPVNVQVPDRYDEGYSQGYADGYNDGHDAGYTEGYDAGYNDGVNNVFIYGSIESGGTVSGKDSNVSIVYTEYPYNPDGYTITSNGSTFKIYIGATWDIYVDGNYYRSASVMWTYDCYRDLKIHNWYVKNYDSYKGALYISYSYTDLYTDTKPIYMNHFALADKYLYNFVPTK